MLYWSDGARLQYGIGPKKKKKKEEKDTTSVSQSLNARASPFSRPSLYPVLLDPSACDAMAGRFFAPRLLHSLGTGRLLCQEM